MFSIDKCKLMFLDSLRSHRNCSYNTIISYRTDLDQFIRFYRDIKGVNDFPITSVDGVCISHFKNELIYKGLKTSTVARKMTALRTFFRFLLREKMIEANPMLFIINPSVPRSSDVEISPKNIEHAIESIPNDTFVGVRDRAILEVFYGGGIRLGELVNLKLADLDLKAGLMSVGNKRRDSRITPIGQPAVEAITKYIRLRYCLIKELEVQGVPEALFLAINAKPLSRRSIQKRVYESLYRIADVRAFNPNILRQSFKAHLLNSGADVNSVRYMLGQVVTSSLNSPPERPIEELIEAYGKAHPRSN